MVTYSLKFPFILSQRTITAVVYGVPTPVFQCPRHRLNQVGRQSRHRNILGPLRLKPIRHGMTAVLPPTH